MLACIWLAYIFMLCGISSTQQLKRGQRKRSWDKLGVYAMRGLLLASTRLQAIVRGRQILGCEIARAASGEPIMTCQPSFLRLFLRVV